MPSNSPPNCAYNIRSIMESNSKGFEASVDPYPGLASFADRAEDRLLFSGRDKESQTLLDMILSESLVLLFSRSGVGKTSLINAGLLEELRKKGFFPVVVRMTHDAKGGPIKSVYECVEEEAKQGGVTTIGNSERQSLWQYFHEAEFSKEDRTVRPVLILDQFEELFTVVRSKKEAFITDLADLARHRVPEDVRTRETAKLEKLAPEDPERKRIVSLLYEGEGPDVKILISIREDFLAEMETLKTQIPTIFRNSFRLEPLTIDQAREAIESPIKQAELLGDKVFTFGLGVVDELINFLRTQKVGGELIRGDSVEPVQLQILCKYLYRESMEKKKRRDQQQRGSKTTPDVVPEITISDLKGRHGMKRAIIGYYRNVLRQFPRLRLGWSRRKYWPSFFNLLLFNRTRSAIRYLCETKLVTPAGYRNSLSIDVIERSVGVSDGDLDRLVDERLLRTEPRLGSRFYELTHDTLIRPLVNTRRKRRFYWAAALFSLLIVLAYLPALANNIFWYLKVRPLQDEASNGRMTDEDRIAALREVLNSDYRNCSGCDLRSLDLHSLRVANVNFSAADLRKAKLNGASIISSDFSTADLSETHLNGAALDFANFTGATLTRADLTKADLQSANLTDAFLKDAKLAGAKLDDADFTDSAIDGADFTDTRWWLATGWTRTRINQLQEKWPRESVVQSELYKKELQAFEMERDSPDESDTLNSRAWFRAVCGVELDKAEADARRALALKSGERKMDTLGYILLQLGKYNEAELLLRQSLQIRERSEADPYRIGLAHYHLALAMDRMGNYSEAQSHFDQAKIKKYVPSHECVLIPPSDAKNCTWPNPRKSK